MVTQDVKMSPIFDQNHLHLMKFDQIFVNIVKRKEDFQGNDGRFNEIRALDIQFG